jgi:streptogramin lyase
MRLHKHIPSSVLFIYTLVFFGGSPATARADTEPNDSIEDAEDSGLVGEGSVTLGGGTLSEGDAVDYYFFDIPQGADLPKLLTVSALGSAMLDGHLDLLHEPGFFIDANDDAAYPDLDPLIRTYLLSEGRYYVGMTGMPGASQGSYDLTITVEAADPLTSTLEPNDDTTTATDTGGGPYEALGEFIGDGTEGRLDIDVYRITLAGSAIIQADASVDHLDSTLDPVLELRQGFSAEARNPVGAITANDNANLDTRDAHVEAGVFLAGDYYLVVTGAGNVLPVLDPALRAPGSVGFYDLSIEVIPFSDPGGPYESNDSIQEATPSGLAGPGQVTHAAYIGDGPFSATRGDVDFYEVEAADGQLLTVDVDAAVIGSGLDSVVVVFDYLGTVLAANDNDGATTDSYQTVEARLPIPDDPPPDGPPATLYVMVLGTRQARPQDPLVPNPASAEVWRSEHVVVGAQSSIGDYDVSLTLSTGLRMAPGPSPPAVSPPPLSQPGSRRIFDTELSFPSKAIVELDPADGMVINSFGIPENLITSSEGLAVFDEDLLYLGTGQFPHLYWLDPDSGEVADDVILWSGSGHYGDIATLNGSVYLCDVFDRSLHELDPQTLQAVRTIDVGTLNGVALSGALASLAHPNRLYVADAFETGAIHAIDPATGQVDASVSPGGPCPCNADFDFDGDVDILDQLFFDDCDAGDGSVRFDCQQVDVDCDGDRDSDDEAILACQYNGPGVPPNEGCCPPDLAPVPVRATALGGSGSARIYVNEWSRESVEVYDQDGLLLSVWDVQTPLGAVGGQPFFVFGDGDDDGDLDLIDFLLFTDCLTGPGSGPVVSTCRVFDAEPDGDVDLDDFAAFQIALSQGL